MARSTMTYSIVIISKNIRFYALGDQQPVREILYFIRDEKLWFLLLFF